MFAKITKLIAGAVVWESVEVGHTRFPLGNVFLKGRVPHERWGGTTDPPELKGESRVESQSLGMPPPVYSPFPPFVNVNCVAATSRLDSACGGEAFSTRFDTPTGLHHHTPWCGLVGGFGHGTKKCWKSISKNDGVGFPKHPPSRSMY